MSTTKKRSSCSYVFWSNFTTLLLSANITYKCFISQWFYCFNSITKRVFLKFLLYLLANEILSLPVESYAQYLLHLWVCTIMFASNFFAIVSFSRIKRTVQVINAAWSPHNEHMVWSSFFWNLIRLTPKSETLKHIMFLQQHFPLQLKRSLGPLLNFSDLLDCA